MISGALDRWDSFHVLLIGTTVYNTGMVLLWYMDDDGAFRNHVSYVPSIVRQVRLIQSDPELRRLSDDRQLNITGNFIVRGASIIAFEVDLGQKRGGALICLEVHES